ncbi:VanZ family protein [Rhodoligotrophos appendicifer]|uniref:VanZ family protein n=1 Tax=Rhodoligotrophos appendicifer TaxID=987056 RepID=UPI00117F46E9|nr:VanZ family protein [Rhodoligotrophos appendicifer]
MRKLLIFSAWGAVGFIALATLSPLRDRPHIHALGGNGEHFIAFAAVTILFSLAYPKRTLEIAVLMTSLVFGLEFAQLVTPDRHARLMDAMVKFAGGLSGLLAAHALPMLVPFAFRRQER